MSKKQWAFVVLAILVFLFLIYQMYQREKEVTQPVVGVQDWLRRHFGI